MRESITLYLPWIISVLTIGHTILVGNKSLHGWTLALFNQVLWSIWVVSAAAWGLLPLNIALWVIYSRNFVKWKRDQ